MTVISDSDKISTNPEVGRFISQDSIEYADPETINGLNLYAYCGNNPVMYIDPTGESLIAVFIILLLGAVAGGIANGVKAAQEGKTGGDLALQIFLGVAIGVAVAGVGLMLGATVVGALGVTFFGVEAAKMFALGAAAFNLITMIVAPFFGLETQSVELNPAPEKPITPYPPITGYNFNKKNFDSNILKEIFKFNGGLNYDKISRGTVSRLQKLVLKTRI